MTTFAAFAFVLLALSTPALADPPAPRPAPMKIRVSLHDASSTRSFDVMVSSDAPCASASHKLADQRFELKACASRDAHLTIEWELRDAAGEYRSTSSIPFEHGATAELGTTAGPRITVKID